MIKDHRVFKPNSQKNKGRIYFFIFKIIIITLVLQGIVSHFLISSYKVNSTSMEPVIMKGDRILTSPLKYGFFFPFSNKRIDGFQKPERGELVLIQPPFSKKKKFPFSLLNDFVKLISLNIVKFDKSIPTFYCKRIIGIPGDTIKIINHTAYIKPFNTGQFFSESEFIKKKYTIKIDSIINHNDYNSFNDFSDWGNVYFLSGNLDDVILKEDEYFVLGDNRTSSNDSRVWGKIGYSNIISKIVLKYFPFNRIGILK